jgi:ribosomal protein S1
MMLQGIVSEGTIVGYNKGGVLVDIGELKGEGAAAAAATASAAAATAVLMHQPGDGTITVGGAFVC